MTSYGNTVQGILDTIDEDYKNFSWELLGVLGDALEDEGSELVYGIRYMVAFKKAPSSWLVVPPGQAVLTSQMGGNRVPEYTWFNKASFPDDVSSHDIDEDLWLKMVSTSRQADHWGEKNFTKVSDAILTFARIYKENRNVNA